MKITVTQEDILNGKPCDCRRCPIKLALARALNDPLCEALSSSFWTTTRPFGHRLIDLPQIACEFIQAFDVHGKAAVQPIEFEVTV